MQFFARLRSGKKKGGSRLFRYGWKVTLAHSVGGSRLRGFPLLRQPGPANVRREECRRNA